MRTFLAIIFICLLLACHKQGEEGKLKIATAANMQYAMDSLLKDFTEESGIYCELIISSSGKLCNQILNGAPYDVFVSADTYYPDKLIEAGKAKGIQEVYAYGKLVLWSMQPEQDVHTSVLLSSSVTHIAMANPEIAPYGRAAKEVIENLRIKEKIGSKLVYGESIASVNQLIYSGAAELGFTAKSVVLSPQVRGKGIYVDIDTELYQPLAQGLVVLNNSNIPDKAEKFRNFMLSKNAAKILARYGYEAEVENFK